MDSLLPRNASPRPPSGRRSAALQQGLSPELPVPAPPPRPARRIPYLTEENSTWRSRPRRQCARGPRRRSRPLRPTGTAQRARGPVAKRPRRDLGQRHRDGPAYNATVSRLYKDDDQQWKTSESFGRDDLLLLAKVLDLAHTWVSEQMQGQDIPF